MPPSFPIPSPHSVSGSSPEDDTRSEAERVAEFKQQVNATFVRGDFAETQRLAEAGLERFTVSGERNGQAMALYFLGAAARSQQRLEESLAFLRRAVDLYESLNDRYGLAVAVNGIGVTYKFQRDYPAALHQFDRSLILGKEIGDRSIEANAAGNLSSIYTLLGDHATALEMLSRCLAVFEETGEEHKAAIALQNLGINYTLLKDHRSAVDVLRRGMAIQEQLGDRYHLASIADALGSAYFEMGEHETGLLCLRQALHIFDELKMPPLVAMSASRLGSALQQMGRLDEAKAALERSLAANGPDGDRVHYGVSLMRLGALYAEPSFSEHDDERALELLREARQIAEELSALDTLSAVYSHLTDLHERRGELREALDTHRLLYQTEQRLFNEQSDERMRSLQVRFDVADARQAARIARQEAEIARLRTVELAAALEEAERLRALADSLARRDALTGVANRRQWDEWLDDEWERTLRTGVPVSVLLMDVDRFKQVNDTFGHAVGDAVLRQVGALLRDCCRASDRVARYGGEEFAVLLSATDAPGARTQGERIRSRIEAEDWSQIAPNLRVTVSLGLGDSALLTAEADRKSASIGEIMRLADRNLYRAKAEGRNRVVG